MSKNQPAEFDGLRAKLYEEALREFPKARSEDIIAMHRYLTPTFGEKILGVGEGNGFFVSEIVKSVGQSGLYTVSDPSSNQLQNLMQAGSFDQLGIINKSAEDLDISEQSKYDKIWSFGAFHHCPKQDIAMQRFYALLKPQGKLVICDVWQGGKLAKHFDGPVAEYCCTGHNVNFLSTQYAKTIVKKAGFQPELTEIVSLPLRWQFEKKKDIGKFIYNLHAMTQIHSECKTKSEGEQYLKVLEGCEKILGITKNNQTQKFELHWPMKALIAYK
jgi:arsenite methyltransferase